MAVAIFAGKTIWENSNRTHLQVPAAIGGMQLIDDPRLGEAVQTLEKIASDNGSAGKAGFYGFSGVPSFFFHRRSDVPCSMPRKRASSATRSAGH